MVVIVEDSKYPQEINIEFVQDKVALLDTLEPGQEVTVTFDIRGREYNGRYFNNLQGWKIAPAQMQSMQPDELQQPPSYTSAPAGLVDDDIRGITAVRFSRWKRWRKRRLASGHAQRCTGNDIPRIPFLDDKHLEFPENPRHRPPWFSILSIIPLLPAAPRVRVDGEHLFEPHPVVNAEKVELFPCTLLRVESPGKLSLPLL